MEDALGRSLTRILEGPAVWLSNISIAEQKREQPGKTVQLGAFPHILRICGNAPSCTVFHSIGICILSQYKTFINLKLRDPPKFKTAQKLEPAEIRLSFGCTDFCVADSVVF